MASIGGWGLIIGLLASVGGSATAGLNRLGASRALLVVAAAALVTATAALGTALVRADFTLTYVADHTRISSTRAYRLAGLWGGREGSLLLFASMLGVTVSVVVRTLGRRGLIAGSAIVGWHAATVLGAANPFHRLAIPAISGSGLTPILETPAMLYHPPLLYAGLVATVVVYLRAFDGRAGGRAVPVALALLTVGLVTGANWAYVEVGWGGFWAWDPVENSALVPWLALVVALHLADRGDRIGATATMAPFVLVCVASVVTRGGGTQSVHAFADSAGVAWSLSGLVVLTLIVAVATIRGRQRGERALSLRVVNAGLGTVAAAVVLFGVLYPLVLDLLAGRTLSVQGTYFARTTYPIAVTALIGLMLWGRWWLALMGALAGLGVAVALGWTGWVTLVLLVAGSGALAAVVMAPDRPARSRVAHAGFALLLVGVGASTMAHTVSGPLAVGARMSVGGYEIENLGVRLVEGPHPGTSEVVADLAVHHGDDRTMLHPGLVAYPELGVLLSEVALRSNPIDDVQVALRDADDQTAVIEAHVRPFTWAVWWGVLLMAAGVACSALPQRRVRVVLAEAG